MRVAAAQLWLSQAFFQSSSRRGKVDWHPFRKAAKQWLKVPLKPTDHWLCIILSYDSKQLAKKLKKKTKENQQITSEVFFSN